MRLKLTENDDIRVQDGKIIAAYEGKEYSFSKEEIEAVMIITTDLGPFYDDMCLAIRINEETAIFMMSEHPRYSDFLFSELKTLVELDYNKAIEASVCTENNIFFLYNRNGM